MIGKCWRKRHDIIRGTVPTFAQNYFENQREPKVEIAGDLNLWSLEYETERLPYRVIRCRRLGYIIQGSVNIMCCFQDYWINTWRDTIWGINFFGIPRTYKAAVGLRESNWPPWWPRCRWENNMKLLRRLGCENVSWIHLAQHETSGGILWTRWWTFELGKRLIIHNYSSNCQLPKMSDCTSMYM